MKTPAFLFALICSVSTDVTASNGCGSAEREEIISLAVLRTEFKCLKEKVEGQFIKLQQAETQLEGQSTKLLQHHTQLEEHAAKLKEQEAELREKQTLIDGLIKNAKDSQVAFSASVTATETVTIGPYNTHTPLIFSHAITNVGNAYNPKTGIFTAPVRGVYHFELHLVGPGTTATGGWLVKNGQTINMAYVHLAANHYQKASTGASVVLEVGEQVSVNQYHESKVYDNGNHHSTFSGHLLFTLPEETLGRR